MVSFCHILATHQGLFFHLLIYGHLAVVVAAVAVAAPAVVVAAVPVAVVAPAVVLLLFIHFALESEPFFYRASSMALSSLGTFSPKIPPSG